ncbi:MAG TPA: hypothetical protein DD638_07945 [Pasteurellaceae bacterium]|nr:hypothetical protein [Pasteurellaceae bacterium]
MKKVSLATILVLSTVAVGLFAQAQTNQSGGYQDQDPNQPKLMQPANSQAGFRPGERPGKPQDDRMGGRRGPHGDMRGPMQGEPQCGAFRDRYPQGNMLRGGFVVSQEPVKVADVEKWSDDQLIVLEGNIIKQVGKRDFVFKDTSGELTLAITRKAWHGETITPNDKVRIVADVEKSWGKTEVEAFFVGKVKSDKQ